MHATFHSSRFFLPLRNQTIDWPSLIGHLIDAIALLIDYIRSAGLFIVYVNTKQLVVTANNN